MIDQTMEGGKAVVYHAYRENGIKKIDRYEDVLPYFYVDEITQVPNFSGIVKIENGFVNIWGEPCKKIICRTPQDVGKIKENFGKTYEADIRFNIRVMIDKQIKPKEKPKLFYFDIESLAVEGSFPEVWIEQFDGTFVKGSEYPICIISSFDEITNEYHSFLLNNEKHQIVEKMRWKNILAGELEPLFVHYYITEQELLREWIKFIQKIDPDVFVGYNSDFFDLPYLFNRMDRLGIDKSQLSPLRWVRVKAPSLKMKNLKDRYRKRDENPPEISLRYCFDLLRGYKESHAGELESKELTNVAEKVLGLKKLKHEKNLFETLRNKDKLLRYNLRDVELVKEIDRKLKITDNFWDLSRFIGCRLDQTFSESQMIDLLWLQEGKFVKNQVLPTKEPSEREQFEGAFVYDSLIGDWVYVILLDLKQLYPSIIRTFRMSPETMLRDIDKEKFDYSQTINLPNGIRFRKDIDSITTNVLAKLFEIRNYYTDKRDNYDNIMIQLKKDGKENTSEYEETKIQYQFNKRMAQHAKDTSNSYYGILAYPGSRLYVPEVGASITMLGQQIIKWAISKVESWGYTILAGDTDSIMVKAKSNNVEDSVKEGFQLSKDIDSTFGEFVKPFNIEPENHYLHIDFKMVMESCVFLAKKRYAYWVAFEKGREEKDFFDAKGLEVRRSDNNDFTKTFMKKMYEIVLLYKRNGLTRDQMIDELCRFVNEKIKEIKTLPIEQLAIRYGFQKDVEKYENNSPYAIGAFWSKKNLGLKLGKGSKPLFIYIKKVPKYSMTIRYREQDVEIKGICFNHPEEIPEGLVVDYEEMTRRLVLDRAQDLFDAIRVPISRLEGQTSLERYI